LKKQDMKMWTGFIWLRIRTTSGLSSARAHKGSKSGGKLLD
jgi:hypothetical protein